MPAQRCLVMKCHTRHCPRSPGARDGWGATRRLPGAGRLACTSDLYLAPPLPSIRGLWCQNVGGCGHCLYPNPGSFLSHSSSSVHRRTLLPRHVATSRCSPQSHARVRPPLPPFPPETLSTATRPSELQGNRHGAGVRLLLLSSGVTATGKSQSFRTHCRRRAGAGWGQGTGVGFPE